MSSTYKKLEEQIDVLIAQCKHLRQQLDSTVKLLATRDEYICALEEEMVKSHADIARLNHKLQARQMHLDAMRHPETAKVWHEAYVKELLK